MSISGLGQLNTNQINTIGGVSSQKQVGHVGDKSVSENHPPALNDSKVLNNSELGKSIIGNYSPMRRPTKPTFASFRKSTTSTQATHQNQSVETTKTPRSSFASIKKEQRSLGGERGRAMIGLNRSMPQAQAQPEVTQQRSDMESQVEKKTTEQTQAASGTKNANKTEEINLSEESSVDFKKSPKKYGRIFHSVSQKITNKIKEVKDNLNAKVFHYDKAIDEKFGREFRKTLSYQEKSAFEDFIKNSTSQPLDEIMPKNCLQAPLKKLLNKYKLSEEDKNALNQLTSNSAEISWNGKRYTQPDQKTKFLFELYKKYVDPSAFPEPEKKTIDTSDLNENETQMFNYLSRFVQDRSGADLKIWAKIFTAGNGLLDTVPNGHPNVLMDDIERMIKQQVENRKLKPEQAEQFKTEQLTKAYQIITEKPELTYEKFKQKIAEQI